MKQYNCPDCNRTDSCDGCYRIDFHTLDPSHIRSDYLPTSCKFCSNHPVNGGSGICHCILGSIEFR